MKSLCASLVMAALVGLVIGCDDPNPPRTGGPGAEQSRDNNTGGPGANQQARNDNPLRNLGVPDNAFKLDPPNLETNINQGERKNVEIGINRGNNFDQDVRLSFENLPKGVKVEPASPVIKAGDKSANVMVEVAKDAAVGHHTITVKGKLMKEGPEATNTFKIEVKKP